jgi:hypothetical protein
MFQTEQLLRKGIATREIIQGTPESTTAGKYPSIK